MNETKIFNVDWKSVDEVKYKSLIEFRQAGTEAELRITADCSSFRPHYCKTPVSRSLFYFVFRFFDDLAILL